jgi:NAD(P)-dependent dehydrogenase (short-subunit alcohol dehydrogenase family)
MIHTHTSGAAVVMAFASPNVAKAPSRTVLVTGGAGYIGSHTCLELLEAEPDTTKVVVVDTLDNSSEESLSRVRALTNCAKGRLHFRNVDVRDKTGLCKGKFVLCDFKQTRKGRTRADVKVISLTLRFFAESPYYTMFSIRSP